MTYQELLNVIQEGDLLFSFNRENLFSKLIFKISLINKILKKKNKVSHSILYIGNSLIAESTIGYGAVIRTINHYHIKKYDLYYGKLNIEYDRKKVVNKAIDLTDGTTYSYLQICIMLIRKLFLKCIPLKDYNSNSMHCSEFVATCYKEAGISFIDNIVPAETSPLDIFNSNLIKTEKIN